MDNKDVQDFINSEFYFNKLDSEYKKVVCLRAVDVCSYLLNKFPFKTEVDISQFLHDSSRARTNLKIYATELEKYKVNEHLIRSTFWEVNKNIRVLYLILLLLNK